LKPAIAYAVENGLVGPIVQSDVYVLHRPLRNREQDLESGKSKFIDWEKAKADIRRRTS
jgi:hypothetical protein